LACALQRKRQLLQDEQKVDLYATITLSGAAEAGQKLLTACTTTATTCTGDTPAEVVGGDVIQGSIQTVPTASVQLVAEPYVTGEPYIFTGTYLRDGTPASAPVILTSDPGSVLSCFSTPGSTGVTTTFTCNPLKEVSEVTVKLSGPTGDLQTSSVVETTVTVYNTSEWLRVLERETAARAGLLAVLFGAGSRQHSLCGSSRQAKPSFCQPPPSCALTLAVNSPSQLTNFPLAAGVLLCAACLKGSIKNDTDSTCTPCERGTFAGPGAETCSPCADVAGLGEGFTTLRMFSFNESQCSCELLVQGLAHTPLMPCCAVTAEGCSPCACMGHQPASLVNCLD
jgi:hypothetical protein